MQHVLLPILVLTAAAAVSAQTHLVGLTAQVPALLKRDQPGCSATSCSPAGFPPTTGLPYLGGTAWDPVLGGAWISNGPVIACVSDTCGYLCPMSPVATPAPITGLEVVESRNEIWATDALSNIVRMTRTCPPAFISSCNTGGLTTPTRGLSGLAVDEGRQLVFYCGADWATGVSRLFVSTMSNVCAPFYNQPVASVCPVVLRPLTGLAVDWGNSVLYMTDGSQTIGWSYVYNPVGFSIVFTPGNCCFSTVAGDQMVGLAVRPDPAWSLGGPCANGSCPNCAMVHTLVGTPNLGNGSFALRLTGAPSGSMAAAALQIGNCIAPGTVVPGLCGPVWMFLPLWGSLGPNFPSGLGCSAATQFPLPLPALPAFAGLPIASQCVALCVGGGTSMSNCLSWMLQGN